MDFEYAYCALILLNLLSLSLFTLHPTAFHPRLQLGGVLTKSETASQMPNKPWPTCMGLVPPKQIASPYRLSRAFTD